METELKFEVTDPGSLRARLGQLGVVLGEEVPEDNRLYDTPSAGLRERGLMLRLRSTPERLLLTVKKTLPGNRAKVRREEEVELGCSLREAERLLALLGLVRRFRYEKVRSSGNLGEVVVCLDRLDIGCFLEIEARSEKEVLEAAAILGFDPGSGITDSYPGLISGKPEER
ncbi:CYTH domain-containing protein [Candidatus Fermentibacteria bacterium]|nr:CYTH domain-containing protein [Candidatus Fermentibacteria bacterium]